MNFVDIHLNDYAAATFHLSPLEDGIYWRLLRCYYRDERPLPSDVDQVARMVGARSEDEIAAVRAVLDEFFSLDADGWRQSRCDAELKRFADKSEKARASAAASWAARRGVDANAKRPHSEGNAFHSPTTHLTTTQERKTPRASRTVGELDPVFAQAWGMYPTRPGNSRADALKAWNARVKAGADPRAMLAGVERYADYCAATMVEPRYIKQAATFFGPGEHYLADWAIPAARAAGAAPSKQADLEARNAAVAQRVLAQMEENPQ